MVAIGAGRYELGEEIARGAIGVVVHAVDTSNGEPVAVKRLRPETAAHPESVIAFLREAEILAHLRHPNILRLRELLAEPDGYALVLDLVNGEDLRRRVRTGGPLAPMAAAEVVATVADALDYLHGQGYQHGDIKPGNVVVPVDGTRVRLVDFGVARRIGEVGQTTYATPEYVAPEVVLGNAPGPAADVYALGMVLFELCTGRSAYRGGTSEEVLRRHLTCVPVPPPGLAEPLWPVIQQCLAFDPHHRPAAHALTGQLRALLPSLSGLVAPAPLAPDAVTWWLREADETAPVLGLQRVAWVPAARQNPESAAPERLVAVPMPGRDTGASALSTEPPTNIALALSGAAATPPASRPAAPVQGAPQQNATPVAQRPVAAPVAAGTGRASSPVPQPAFPTSVGYPPPAAPERRDKSRAPLLIGVAVAVLVLLGLLGVGALALTGAFSGPGPVANPTNQPPASTAVSTSPAPPTPTSSTPTPAPSAEKPTSAPTPGGSKPGTAAPTPSSPLDGSLIGQPLPSFP